MGSYYGVIVALRPGVTLASALQAGADPDEQATVRLVESSHPDLRITSVYEAVMSEAVNAYSSDDIYAAVYPGMGLLCSPRWEFDRPSEFDTRVLTAGLGYPHQTLVAGVVQNVGWAGFGLWDTEHHLVRSVSIAGGPVDHELQEMVGEPLPEEAPWWLGDPDVHPQTLVQSVMLTQVGFDFEHEGPGEPLIDLETVPFLTFDTEPRAG